MTLSEAQWKIGDLKFGKGTPITIVGFEPVGYEIAPGDYQLPSSDEIRHRKDYIQPGVLQFTLGVLDNYILPGMPGSLSDDSRGVSLLEEFRAEWRADNIRKQWGWVKPLRYRAEGLTRILYGRPRNVASDKLKQRAGWYGVTASYQLSDSLAYEDEVQSRLFGPDTAWAGTVSRLAGKAPSWMTVMILGPAVNPVVEIGDLKIEFDGSVATDEILEFNAKPWERRAVQVTAGGLLNVGAKMIGDSCYLEDLRLAAGESLSVEMDATGTSANTRLLVQWQEAHHAI